MKFSLNWLCEFSSLSKYKTKPQKLADLLTSMGFETESFVDYSDSFKNLIVGEILSIKKHPQADRLTLCEVFTGKDKKKIVCGAKNHQLKDKVVLALEGAILPGDFKIKTSKIRGEVSEGMLCSLSELGFESQTDGIIILDPKTSLGKTYAEAVLGNDTIFDVNIPPNRPDCLSHLGLSREISAFLNQKFNHKIKKTKSSLIENKIQVSLKENKKCLRYLARKIKGVKVSKSPFWLTQRLSLLGINSINNVVDISNYMRLKTGQPLHIFDQDKIEGSKIIIDQALKGEQLKSFDGSLLNLNKGDLVIRDNKKILALAGIIGGENSGVSFETKDLLIEVALFDFKKIRETSRKLNLETDSSYLFSRGLDLNQMPEVLEETSQMITEICGGVLSKKYFDLGLKKKALNKIKLSGKQTEDSLGFSVKEMDLKKVMKQINCSFKSGHFIPPSYRLDLNLKEDLIEEYARFKGYEKIPETYPSLSVKPGKSTKTYLFQRKLKDFLTSQSFFEAINFHFLNKKWAKDLFPENSLNFSGISLNGKELDILNPLSSEFDTLRTSLFFYLFKNAIYNIKHKAHQACLFEIGPCYFKNKTDQRLGLISWGAKKSLWDQRDKNYAFFHLKSVLENLMNFLDVRYEWKEDFEKIPSFIHPKKALSLEIEGKAQAYLCQIHPFLTKKYKINEEIYFSELNLNELLKEKEQKTVIQAPSKKPLVKRDFNFVLAKNQKAGLILEAFKKMPLKDLSHVQIVDYFKSEDLLRVTYQFSFQSHLESISDTALQEIHQEITAYAEKNFKIKLKD